MLDSNSPAWQHMLQDLALVALSLFFLPLDTFITFWSLAYGYVFQSRVENNRRIARQRSGFKPRTILVTGVGMTKGLALARLFYEAGHDVVGADFEPMGTRVAGRVSKAVKKFVPLRKPNNKDGSARYIQGLLDVIGKEGIDLWVSCSGVASAVEDGEAKQIVEARTRCKAIQFDVKTTQMLHEKHTFIEHTKELGLVVPETYTVKKRAEVDETLRDAPQGRRYIMKTIGMDDANRGDMTLLPKSSPQETSKHLSKLAISEQSPWIIQQFIKGQEFCTHSLVIKGHVKAFVACPSAELLMHYQALPTNSRLSKEMLKFTQTYAKNGGNSFTGHLSFDFLVEDAELDLLQTDPNTEINLYPIECNPRAHTAVALFAHTTSMADAYLSLLDESVNEPSSYAEAAANGTLNENIVYPRYPFGRYYWVGHDLVNLLILPLLSLVTMQHDSSVSTLVKGLDEFVDRVVFWRDGTYEVWDPMPWWWLYHVYWPWQFLLSLYTGKKWSRVNVSTCKIFEC
ncbi:hypothetical protein LTS08_004761 [Lithohypha guttulata]|uniref:ATP-grasp domain-containing protein n=1 Tax=Lithohypha guttulata TaxID=1690604 RepID=A0AAN7Y814_9EURO|nr:hypothetical protein LTR05_002397 [Lithohypha guttulata]KAK5101155.1 hypothetical protein LTS08_004761 [Lithohypha guttulata]